MGKQQPSYLENSNTATDPSQLYGWNSSAERPVRLRATSDGDIVVRDLTSDIDWDAITPTYNATSDVYIFSKSAVTTATITVSYSDSTKAVLTGVTKVLA